MIFRRRLSSFFPSTCIKLYLYGVFLMSASEIYRQNLIIHKYGDNERVRNGEGGTERRFTLSTVCTCTESSGLCRAGLNPV